MGGGAAAPRRYVIFTDQTYPAPASSDKPGLN